MYWQNTTAPLARVSVALLLAVSLTRLNGSEKALKPEAQFGPDPVLPAPEKSILPTVDIAPAKGWPGDTVPQAAAGLRANVFARGLDHPRWLLVLPNGDVLVAETNAPPRPQEGKGIKGAAMKMMMKKAGAAVPSANRISLLRDRDGDGVAETKTIFLQGLTSPFGMTLIGENLYVANTDGVMRFPYPAGADQITAPGVKLADLPAGPRNHHWTKNLIANRDGSKLYATVGSNSNVAEHGLAEETGRAAVYEIDVASGRSRIFASGLRNPVGLAWEPQSGLLWTTVNERDELGNDLVPDYMTALKDGGFYGWPFSYFGQHVDPRVTEQRPDLVARALKPDYALGSHTASLGLAFYEGSLLPARYSGGAIVGQHGSWNRKPLAGYKVIFVPFKNGTPAGPPEDLLFGFLNDAGEAMGRPVGVAVDTKGAVLVADDVGNVIWRVSPAR